MNKSIFISKNASEVEPYCSQFEELGYSVISHSFLSFSPIGFNVEHSFDVIFFGSPRAVIFYLANASISGYKLIACVGGKTAELLESMGHKVAFTGTKSGEPKLVAEDFKVWLGNKRVLFPVSDRSLKTIAGNIPENQKEEVVVYSTDVKGRVVEECDVYVFTSPSNVEGYLVENVVPEGAKIVAWGKSTERALVEGGVTVGKVLEESGFEELFICLK